MAQGKSIASKILRLNPGPLPEAAQLAEMSKGMRQVREIIARETMGSVSPNTQLFAVDFLMQQHHDAIASVVKASATRHHRTLSGADALQLVLSILEHVAMASYWLRLAHHYRKIPVEKPYRHDASTAKSKQRREQVLNKIKGDCRMALEMIEDLKTITPMPPDTARLLMSLTLQMVCIQVNAKVTVLTSGNAPRPSPNQLDPLLDKLDEFRLAPDFGSRAAGDQALVWHTRALVLEAKGDLQNLRDAVRQRVDLVISSTSAEEKIGALVESLGLEDEPEARLDLLVRIRNTVELAELGSLFSRERIGRLSVLRDSIWRAALSVPCDHIISGPLLEEAFAIYEKILFGENSEIDPRNIWIFTSFRGQVRIAWRSLDKWVMRDFNVDPELVGRFIFAMDRASTSKPKEMLEILAYQDEVLGPPLADALYSLTGARIHAVGHAGVLPVMASTVDEAALAGSADIACWHPRGGPATESCSGPIETLIVDTCFEDDAAAVENSILRMASFFSSSCNVVTFDSSQERTALPITAFVDALTGSSHVLVFCHLTSPIAEASKSALVLGPTTSLTTEELAGLELMHMRELILVACGSGRGNSLVGQATVAHAAALAGVDEVLYTLWPIRSNDGAAVIQRLVDVRIGGGTTSQFFRENMKSDRTKGASFSILRN